MAAQYLYHWTPAICLPSVGEHGLDPAYAMGRRKVIWMADESSVMWAASHAAMHQCCSPDALVLVRIRVDGLRLTRTAWPGVMNCATVIRPSRLRVVTVGISRRARRLPGKRKLKRESV